MISEAEDRMEHPGARLSVRRHRLDDGRELLLYTEAGGSGPGGRAEPPERSAADDRSGRTGELRWDARRGEWVIVAPHRQQRTYQPPAADCPFCPTRRGGPRTEVPFESFDIAVFENRFPSLAGAAPADAPAGAGGATAARPVAERTHPSAGALYASAPAFGRCEVVVYSPEHDGSLGTFSVARIERLLRVWAHRYRELGDAPGIECVTIFENRGEEIGVTLHHPHGQIYAYPLLPPVPAAERDRERAHEAATGRCLHCDLLAWELERAERVLFEDDHVVSFVPYAARWPFETHIVVRMHRASLVELEAAERRGLAAGLRRVLLGIDALFDRPMPYLLAVRQAPTAERAHGGSHVRIELCPARRAADKLKHRAGSETSTGTMVHDLGPERAAERLREALRIA